MNGLVFIFLLFALGVAVWAWTGDCGNCGNCEKCEKRKVRKVR